MKKSDIAMIILIASLSVGVAYLIANALPFLKIDEKGVVVSTIEEIKPDVKQPSEKIFHPDAINPTIETLIGGNASAD
jgi:hypothetical protein